MTTEKGNLRRPFNISELYVVGGPLVDEGAWRRNGWRAGLELDRRGFVLGQAYRRRTNQKMVTQAGTRMARVGHVWQANRDFREEFGVAFQSMPGELIADMRALYLRPFSMFMSAFFNSWRTLVVDIPSDSVMLRKASIGKFNEYMDKSYLNYRGEWPVRNGTRALMMLMLGFTRNWVGEVRSDKYRYRRQVGELIGNLESRISYGLSDGIYMELVGGHFGAGSTLPEVPAKIVTKTGAEIDGSRY